MAYWLQLTNRQPISAQGGMDGGQESVSESRGRGCAETTEPRTNSRGEKNAKAEEKLDK